MDLFSVMMMKNLTKIWLKFWLISEIKKPLKNSGLTISKPVKPSLNSWNNQFKIMIMKISKRILFYIKSQLIFSCSEILPPMTRVNTRWLLKEKESMKMILNGNQKHSMKNANFKTNKTPRIFSILLFLLL